jgi:hypothetical protein
LIQPFQGIIKQAKWDRSLNSPSASTYAATLENMTEIESGDLLMTSQGRRGPDYRRRNSQIGFYKSLCEIRSGIETFPSPKESGNILGHLSNNFGKTWNL